MSSLLGFVRVVCINMNETEFLAMTSRRGALSAAKCGAKLGLQHFVMRSEGRKLYRDVLRALKGVDADTAAGVKQAARERFAEHTDETNLERLRTLLVDGRHSLNEMKQFMVTAVVR